MRSMPTNATLLSLRLCVSCTALLVFTFVTNAWVEFHEENVERSAEQTKDLKGTLRQITRNLMVR